ncbi:MAG: FtsQ-type POTRA domain-containing protein [Candidatus Aminicenantes bacterium]|nr:FtsQ-type POTRA domain-containing protein [Candidatus Aminicenantes bacterium]
MSDTRSHSLKFEAEFFRKSNNLTLTREKKIRSIQMRSMHICLLLLVTLLVGFSVYKAAVFLLECDMLQVRSYRLRRQPVFAREEVRRILSHRAGNILTLDLRSLRAQLLRLPEVENVAISRILPDTVEIDFILRQPLFYTNQNGVYQLLDASGLVLGEQAAEPKGLIPIRGNDMSLMSQIAAISEELLPMRQKIEYIGYHEPVGIELKLRSSPEVFFPGLDGFVKKINRYFKIKPHLPMHGARIRNVDLRLAGRIYFECFAEPQGES